MRMLVLAVAGFFATTIAPTMGADLQPAKAVSAIVAPINWTGFYVGINGGAGMADNAIFNPDCNGCENVKFRTAFGTAGGQFGYNWQWRAMVLGLEGDLNWTSTNASTSFSLCCALGSAHFKLNAFGSVRGRMGLAFDNALIYVTAGPVWGRFKSTTFLLDGSLLEESSDNGWHPGLAFGTGVEFIMTGNWVLRGEYLFLNFKDINRPSLSDSVLTCGDTSCRVNYAYSAHIARLGLNYRFGN